MYELFTTVTAQEPLGITPLEFFYTMLYDIGRVAEFALVQINLLYGSLGYFLLDGLTHLLGYFNGVNVLTWNASVHVVWA